MPPDELVVDEELEPELVEPLLELLEDELLEDELELLPQTTPPSA